MQANSRRRIVQKKLFQYREYCAAIDEYVQCSCGQTMRKNETGVRGSFRADPTARGGIALANPPKSITYMMRWVQAIEDTWRECALEDDADCLEGIGLVRLMVDYFCLATEPRPRDENEQARERLCETCGISRSTFYERLNRISDIAVYHAARNGLL